MSVDAGALQLRHEGFWIGERPGADPGNRWRGCKLSRCLLKQDDVATLRTGPHCPDDTAARAQDAPQLACGRGSVDDIHKAERCEHDVEGRVRSGYLLGAPLAQFDIGASRLGDAPLGQRKHLRADIDPGYASGGTNQSGGFNRQRTGSGSKIQNPLARC